MRFLFFLYRFYIGLGSGLIALALYIGGWKKTVLLENARRCAVAPRFFRIRWYAHAASDLLRFMHGVYGSPIQVRPQDQDKLKKLKSGAGLFLTAHFHNWELMGGWLVGQRVPLLSAARPMVQSWAQSGLAFFRSRISSRTVDSDVPRAALRHLDGKGCFALLWDQRAPRSPVKARLFGLTLGMDPLPPFLIRHRECAIWFGVLLPDGTFRLLLLSPGLRPSSASHSPDRIARRYHRVLELLIRRHPTWWYGMAHRRFLEASNRSENRSEDRGSVPVLESVFHVKH
jgi:lauroyl/myristoyl acyltransferase